MAERGRFGAIIDAWGVVASHKKGVLFLMSGLLAGLTYEEARSFFNYANRRILDHTDGRGDAASLFVHLDEVFGGERKQKALIGITTAGSPDERVNQRLLLDPVVRVRERRLRAKRLLNPLGMRFYMQEVSWAEADPSSGITREYTERAFVGEKKTISHINPDDLDSVKSAASNYCYYPALRPHMLPYYFSN